MNKNPNAETRPLKKGDRVQVRNQTIGGEPCIEGVATIVKCYPLQNRFQVHFDGDPKDETVTRFLVPTDRIK